MECEGSPRGGSLFGMGVHGALLTAACIAAALIKERCVCGAIYMVSSLLDATNSCRKRLGTRDFVKIRDHTL